MSINIWVGRGATCTRKKFETNEKVDIVKHSLQYGLRLFVHDLHFYRMGWFFM